MGNDHDHGAGHDHSHGAGAYRDADRKALKIAAVLTAGFMLSGAARAVVNDLPGGPAVLQIDLHPVSYTHLRAHETVLDIVCRLLLEKKKHH